MKKLQVVQNSAARVVTGTRKYDRITPAIIMIIVISCAFLILKIDVKYIYFVESDLYLQILTFLVHILFCVAVH